MNTKIVPICVICLYLIFLLMACSKNTDSIDKLNKDKIIDTIKDFGYKEEQGEILYKEGERLEDGGIKIESSKGAIFSFDRNSDIIHADVLSSLKWSDVREEDLKYPEKEYVKFIKDKYVPLNYTEEKIGDYIKEYSMYSFYNVNAANIFNPYDQVRVVFDNRENSVILFDVIDDYKIEKFPQIDEVKAKNIAKDFLSESKKKQSENVLNITLKVIESNNFFKDSSYIADSKSNIKESKIGVYHLAYVIEFEDVLIYVDAYDGKIIGGDCF